MSPRNGDALAFGLEDAPAKESRRNRLLQLKRQLSHPTVETGPLASTSLSSANLQSADPDSISPQNLSQRYYERAVAFMDRGQFQSAASLLTRVVRETDSHVEALFRLGYAYGELKRHDRAIDCFTKVIELMPDRAEAWTNRGWQRYQKRDSPGAINDLIHAVTLNPHSEPAWVMLGLTYTRIQNLEKAVEAFRQALLEDSSNESNCLRFARLLRRAGHREEATVWFARASEVNPLNLEARIRLVFRKPKESVKTIPSEKKLTPAEPSLPNLGKVVENVPSMASRAKLTPQDRLIQIWRALQNPVTWIFIFIFGAIIYVLLGN